LFNQGIRPAVNVGLSVSRIGSAAQVKAMKQVAGTIKLELAQYREIESFASFAADLDISTQRTLNRGVRLITTIKQQNKQVLNVETESLLLFAAMNGVFDHIEEKKLDLFKIYLLNYISVSNVLDNYSVDYLLDQEMLMKAFNYLDV